MSYVLMICRSLTYAQNTANVLARYKIPSTVQRAPKALSPHGCGYCVRIPEPHLEQAIQAMSRHHLTYSKLFRMLDRGEYEEVRL